MVADVERLQHLAHQQDKEIDETAQHLKDLKENRDRISRELSEAKHVPAACSTLRGHGCMCAGWHGLEITALEA